MPLLIVVERGSQTGFLVNKDEFLIGRNENADLPLPSSWVSREHAKITHEGPDYYLTDLNSKHGTKLNGRPVGEFPTPLRYKDVILIAQSIVLKFVDAGDTGELPSPEEIQENPAIVQEYIGRFDLAEMVQNRPTREITTFPVFISHSSKDDQAVDDFRVELEMAGIMSWIDHVHLPPGYDWDIGIEKALTRAKIMIVILTPEAIASKNVRAEWMRFRDQDREIFPVKLKSCNTPLFLATYQVVDLSDKNLYEAELKRLITAIRHALELIAAPDTPASE
jgi:hypothetical protein